MNQEYTINVFMDVNFTQLKAAALNYLMLDWNICRSVENWEDFIVFFSVYSCIFHFLAFYVRVFLVIINFAMSFYWGKRSCS